MANFHTPVEIGDILYLVMTDTLFEGINRYTIEECEVLDVSRNHGFLITDDERDWKPYKEIGETYFFTLNEAIESIINNPGYEGFTYYDINDEEWQMIKRNKYYIGQAFYRLSKNEEKEGKERYTITQLLVTDTSQTHGFVLQDEDKWISDPEMHNLFENVKEAEQELKDQKDYEGHIFIDHKQNQH